MSEAWTSVLIGALDPDTRWALPLFATNVVLIVLGLAILVDHWRSNHKEGR